MLQYYELCSKYDSEHKIAQGPYMNFGLWYLLQKATELCGCYNLMESF